MPASPPRRTQVALAFALVAVASSARADDDLERFLAAPYASELVAAGGRVAWALDEAGRRSLWTARAGEPARALVRFERDDGLLLSQLRLSDDGQLLAYVRGAGAAGGIANPTSDVHGGTRALWLVASAGGEPWSLGDGAHPAFAPDGKRLAFVRGGELHVAGGERFKQDSAVKTRGVITAVEWAPDGRRLAFAVDRKDHGFVGVYDVAAQAITWMAPGVDHDLAPAWSPDGSEVAFVRLAGDAFDAPGPLTFLAPPQPFELWIADAKSGQGRRRWTSPAGAGGYAQEEIARPLLWSADGHLVFFSEADGWLRIYGLEAHGAATRPTALSPAGCEADDARLSGDGRALVFGSNCGGDLDRRHLWRVAARGGQAEALTRGDGLEWSPWPLGHGDSDGDAIVCMMSTGAQPALPARLAGGQLTPLTPLPTLPAAQAAVAPTMVTWRAPDGLVVHGQLFTPPAAAARGRAPALLFLHGGPVRQMLPGWPAMGYYHAMYALSQYFAAHGYVVLAPNFRAGIGYGRGFRVAPRIGPAGAAEYQDVLSAARFLQRRADVDPRRVGVWGGSYGGYLTALALARNSDLFVAGVDFAGLHDWSQDKDRVDRLHPGFAAWKAQAQAASAVGSIGRWRAPVLFFHGDDDANVDFRQTVDLVQRLRRLGRAPVEVTVLPDEVHFLLRHQSYVTLGRGAAAFLDRYLRPGAL